MASGPTPQTRFEAWGQALIGIKNTATPHQEEEARGLLALIMISDVQREWAAWYYYNSKYEEDIQLMGKYVPEILGEKPAHSSHFTTQRAMRVDQLCGDSSQPFSGQPMRLAGLTRVNRDVGDDFFELLLFVQSASPGSAPMNQIGDRPTTHPIHLVLNEQMARATLATIHSALDGSATREFTSGLIFCGRIAALMKNCGRWKTCFCIGVARNSAWASSPAGEGERSFFQRHR
jgi:hypothetical protein